jgi:ribonuclease T2
LSAHDYFATVRNVRQRLNIPTMLQAPREQLRLSPQDLEQAFIAANANLRSDNMAVTCSDGEFIDVRFCLSKDLTAYAICRKVARHSCQRESIVVAPVR